MRKLYPTKVMKIRAGAASARTRVVKCEMERGQAMRSQTKEL